MRERVVITGTGLVSSLGQTKAETWSALCAGRSGVRPLSEFPTSGFACHDAAPVAALNTESMGIHPRDARIMGKHVYLLLLAAREAFTQAFPDGTTPPGEETAFYAGLGMVDYEVDDLRPAVVKAHSPQGGVDLDAFFGGTYQEIHPLWPLSMLNNIGFCQVANMLGVRGDNCVFSPHADAGARALAEAVSIIQEGRATAAIAAGVSETVSPLSLARAHLGGEYQPGQPCPRLGEGCGALVLESETATQRSSATGLAALAGTSCIFSPEEMQLQSETVIAAMLAALQAAQLDPSAIDLLLTHGDGSSGWDCAESDAIRHLFPKVGRQPQLFCSKAALGDLLAGAPLVDVALAVETIRTGMVALPRLVPSSGGGFKREAGIWQPQPVQVKKIMINCRSRAGAWASMVVVALE